ncbi:hypothetical protein A3F02_02145 [Candidatus Curtissbacteria bacterium RIFCSPHIGHO2_12_FULL_38_9b]|uniref:DUF2933 domain-containing protein n=2 Tax=Candidatus Curtissiibacteriota TaxID=1752717 RepID=A0A1F5GZ42_9BACT|nr:MAG: hypothetical protein A3A48_01435 [Candidatus Curtissbacteria bacterium RIFCSPLOWO2_01_FULL_37_9]OGD97128.1 MAG: hypothetical protein A3F02_02145 [Candidatus Curtissbacteria bacterium RIFCSPHIGHO2_12_FULL_38_9b]
MNKLFKRHGLFMILGCLVPIFVFGLFALFGVSQKSLFILLALACPLGHIFFMGRHGEKHHK